MLDLLWRPLIQGNHLALTMLNRTILLHKTAFNSFFCSHEKLCKSGHRLFSLCGNDILSLSKARTTSFGLISFSYFSAKLWNVLPYCIQVLLQTYGEKSRPVFLCICSSFIYIITSVKFINYLVSFKWIKYFFKFQLFHFLVDIGCYKLHWNSREKRLMHVFMYVCMSVCLSVCGWVGR